MIGELRVVEDVGGAFAELAADELARQGPGARRFRLGCSGGASGVDCFRTPRRRTGHSLGGGRVLLRRRALRRPGRRRTRTRVAIAAALGGVVDELAGFHPMSCSAGPAAYGAVVAAAGRFRPPPAGLGAGRAHRLALPRAPTAGTLPPGRSSSPTPIPRDGTGSDASRSRSRRSRVRRLVVVAVSGADKAGALGRIAAGDDLPAAHIRGGRVVWLVDHEAAAGAHL